MKNPIKEFFRRFRSESKKPKKFEADLYIVSYPKCGRTWLRTLIGKYLTLKYDIPDEFILDSKIITHKTDLEITKFTHHGWDIQLEKKAEELNFKHKKFRDKKVILLGRNVKDTLVSAYFQATNRVGYFEGSISELIRDEKFGAKKLLEYYKTWQENRHVTESFIFISYEEMKDDTEAVLRKVLEIMGEEDIDEKLLQQSIEYCSFENLKKVEARNTLQADILKAKDPDDPNSYKVRKGVVGGYKQHLSEKDEKYIDALFDKYALNFPINKLQT